MRRCLQHRHGWSSTAPKCQSPGAPKPSYMLVYEKQGRTPHISPITQTTAIPNRLRLVTSATPPFVHCHWPSSTAGSSPPAYLSAKPPAGGSCAPEGGVWRGRQGTPSHPAAAAAARLPGPAARPPHSRQSRGGQGRHALHQPGLPRPYSKTDLAGALCLQEAGK